MKNKLEQLKSMSTVVADTGEFKNIQKFKPEDATTNPSLLYKVAQNNEYQNYIHNAIQWATTQGGTQNEQLQNTLSKFAVDIGKEILQIIPGRISTEVDARLSFDTTATIKQAEYLIHLYQQIGIEPQRVLIKIAATWEGIEAAKVLEQQGIACNLTLLFGFHQAIACALANVTLISPFVGRILDWYKKDTGQSHYPADQDPGVLSVTKIYNYYKSYDYNTIIMGASFRNIEEIEQLAGCDRLTISPALMQQLQQDSTILQRKLTPSTKSDTDKISTLSEQNFRWAMNQSPMATEKLAEGIRNFAADQNRLESLILSMSNS